MVVNIVAVGLFEDEAEEIGVASDVVKTKGEDPETLGYLRRGRRRSQTRVRLPWLAHDEALGPYITILGIAIFFAVAFAVYFIFQIFNNQKIELHAKTSILPKL